MSGTKRESLTHVDDYLLESSESNFTQLPNCFVHGDQPNQTPNIEFTKIKNVSVLKDLIKEKRSRRLEND